MGVFGTDLQNANNNNNQNSLSTTVNVPAAEQRPWFGDPNLERRLGWALYGVLIVLAIYIAVHTLKTVVPEGTWMRCYNAIHLRLCTPRRGGNDDSDTPGADPSLVPSGVSIAPRQYTLADALAALATEPEIGDESKHLETPKSSPVIRMGDADEPAHLPTEGGIIAPVIDHSDANEPPSSDLRPEGIVEPSSALGLGRAVVTEGDDMLAPTAAAASSVSAIIAARCSFSRLERVPLAVRRCLLVVFVGFCLWFFCYMIPARAITRAWVDLTVPEFMTPFQMAFAGADAILWAHQLYAWWPHITIGLYASLRLLRWACASEQSK